jgi:membrane protein implicated in regulation of membrane protease activity
MLGLTLGLLLMIALILTALHMIVPDIRFRMTLVVILAILMFMIPSMHTMFFGVLFISCEILTNKMLKNIKERRR